MKRKGSAEPDVLVALLAGLWELVPWVKQWHNELDTEFGVGMGDYFEGFIDEEARALSLTTEAIGAWAPPKGRRKTKARKKTGGGASTGRSRRRKAST